VRPERFELPTCCSGGNRSIQLSYGRARMSTVYMGKGRSINVKIAAESNASTQNPTVANAHCEGNNAHCHSFRAQ
jgi:hypothetical protein